MLTRLKVAGFKNLVDVDVRFGPFTCIAGINGVGKSNLLDAIAFLSALADRPLVEAAMSVRDEERRTGDVAALFHRYGNTHSMKMSFEAEMIVPSTGVDDLGQPAVATTTFVNYNLELGYRQEEAKRSLGPLEIVSEALTHIRVSEARKKLGFPVDGSWFKSAITGRRWTKSYISTTRDANGARVINVHQDGGSSGKPRPLLAASLPRTAISAANAAESPTAMLVKREMQSWRRLQLEPTALRSPDSLTSPTALGVDGSHLPATLYELAHHPYFSQEDENGGRVYALAANRLSELIEDCRTLKIDRDEKRELLTLLVGGKDGTMHPARALSDGTLRFLALAVLELDPDFHGVLCMEEPENGIHPARIPAILKLLQDIATDTDETIGQDNPLRQVVINTHSPAVVSQVPEGSLLIAQSKHALMESGVPFDKVSFSCLPGTWRETFETPAVPMGKLLSYLAPVEQPNNENAVRQKEPRVIDNVFVQGLLFSDLVK